MPIVATPRPTAYDKLIFDTWRRSAEELSGPRTEPDSAWMQASRLETLFMRTTRFVNDSGDAHTLQGIRGMAKGYKESSWSLADYAAQLRAIASHDISARFSGDMSRAAAATRARLLIVWSPDDMLVDPRPAEAFSRRRCRDAGRAECVRSRGVLVRAGADRARGTSSSTGRRVSQPVNA